MKKRFLLLVPVFLVLGLWLYMALLPGQPLGQERTEGRGIVMLPSTYPVRKDLQQRALELLAEGAPERGIFVYAITNIDTVSGYHHVSVAGLPMDATEMHLQDALWLGVVTIADMPGLPGEVLDSLPLEEKGGNNPGYGVGGSQNILPWRSGTTAIYGVLGVHDCGFSLNGWKAVDFFPEENMVYSTNDGNVSYVCRDSTQVALRIGENLYTHLADMGQATGDHYAQGQQIAGMVPGSYDDTCGYADQQPDHYHVHFCFIPNPAGTWSADGYALNIGNQNWVKGAETVSPLGTLTASWTDAGVVTLPGPAAGTNFWDGMVGGLINMFNGATAPLPEHEVIGLADTVMDQANPVMSLLYIIVFSNFNMTIPILVFGIVTLLEAVRIFYALYMLVKRLIPVIG